MSFDAMGIYPSLVSDVRCLHAARRVRSVKDKVVMLDRWGWNLMVIIYSNWAVTDCRSLWDCAWIFLMVI